MDLVVGFILGIVWWSETTPGAWAQQIIDDPPGPGFFESVAPSFWIALGLATGIILACLCCLFFARHKSLMNALPLNPNAPGGGALSYNNAHAQTGSGGRDNDGYWSEYADPPPAYSDALKYVLSKDDNPPEYSETYL